MNYWERIIQKSLPNKVLRQDWSSYTSLDFGQTFLPSVNNYIGESIRIFDGAELFTSKKNNGEKLIFIQGDEPINNIIYTFPDTVLAGSKKDVLTVSKNEVCTFIEVLENESINIRFKFGNIFKKILADYLINDNQKKSIETLEDTIYTSNLNSIKKTFSGGTNHKNISEFIINSLNVGEVFMAKEKSFEKIKSIIEEIKNDYPPFDAGFVKDKSPDSFGHGDIELKALTKIFSKNDIYKIYYGNWLRDYSSVITATTVGFSIKDVATLKEKQPFKNSKLVKSILVQLKNKFSYSALIEIVEIVSIKEFIYNRKSNPEEDFYKDKKEFKLKYGTLTKDLLGLYRPEEHIDNPKGLMDESILAHSLLEGPISFNYEYSKGVFKKRTLFKGGETDDKLSLKINSENMKTFIKEDVNTNRPSSLTYFSEQLRLAKSKGKNKEGYRHFGAALHVLEDYYAHSNFAEIALIKNGYIDVFPWVEPKPEIEKIKDKVKKAKKIPIVTGLFSSDDMIASLAPKIADEIFPTDFQDYKSIKAGKRTYFDVLFLVVIKDYAKKEKNIEKEKKTKLYGYTYEEIKDMFNSYLKYRDVWATYVASNIFYKALDWLTHQVGQGLKFFPNLLFNMLLSGLYDGVREEQSRNNINFGTNPTHTQIAKDPSDHPLNPLAGILAYAAVKRVGDDMKKCWAGQLKIEKVISTANEFFFAHPSDVSWMDKGVLTWAKNHKSAVAKAKEKTVVMHYEKQIKRTIKLTEDEIKKLNEQYKKKR